MKERAFEEAAKALRAGDDRRHLSRGQADRDRRPATSSGRASQRILEQAPVPVVPLALRGLVGQFFQPIASRARRCADGAECFPASRWSRERRSRRSWRHRKRCKERSRTAWRLAIRRHIRLGPLDHPSDGQRGFGAHDCREQGRVIMWALGLIIGTLISALVAQGGGAFVGGVVGLVAGIIFGLQRKSVKRPGRDARIADAGPRVAHQRAGPARGDSCSRGDIGPRCDRGRVVRFVGTERASQTLLASSRKSVSRRMRIGWPACIELLSLSVLAALFVASQTLNVLVAYD